MTRCCGRVNLFGAARAPEWLSPDPLLALGPRCFVPWCRGGCPASHGQASSRALLTGRPHPWGEWKRNFCGRKGSALLVKARWSSLLSAGHRQGEEHSGWTRPGLSHAALVSWLASPCGRGNGRRRRRQCLHSARAMAFGARSLLGCAGGLQLFPELLAEHRDAGTLATCRDGSMEAGMPEWDG